MTRSAWHERPEVGSTLGMRTTVWLYRHLGRHVARLILVPVVAYFWATGAAARAASRDYLERMARDPLAAPRLGARRARVFRHFLGFGNSILDRVGFWLGDRADFDLIVRGREHLDRVAREGRGALVLGSHLGSFDALRMIATTSPIPVRVLMYTRHAERINGIFDSLAASSGQSAARVSVIPVVPGSFDHVLAARKAIARGEVVAILADRAPPAERSRTSRVTFFGAPAQLPRGPFRLAAALRVPVLFMVALRMGDARYEIDVEPIFEGVELARAGRGTALDELCQTYADRLAAHCRRAPYQWFNFFEFWDHGAAVADARVV